jgi:DNA-directed RNA polymerase specialized sigma24 family protein
MKKARWKSLRPPPHSQLPPELAALSAEEFGKACDLIKGMAIKLMKRPEEADELYWTVWSRLLTDKRYDPAKGPLEPWLVLVTKGEYKNAIEKKASKRRRDATAHERYHYEEGLTSIASTEDQMIAHAEDSAKQAEVARDLRALAARAADHPIALRVLELRKEGHKPAAIAEILGVPTKKVYEANESLKDYLKEIRTEQGHPPPNDEKT